MEKLSKAREKKIQMSLEKKKMKKEKGIPVFVDCVLIGNM